MQKKVTWKDIYKDFRSRHPNLKNRIMDYKPYDFMSIMLYTVDGEALVYNYSTHEATFVKH